MWGAMLDLACPFSRSGSFLTTTRHVPKKESHAGDTANNSQYQAQQESNKDCVSAVYTAVSAQNVGIARKQGDDHAAVKPWNSRCDKGDDTQHCLEHSSYARSHFR